MEYKIDSVAYQMENYISNLQRFNLQIKSRQYPSLLNENEYTITLNSLEELNELGRILDAHLILKPGRISIYDGYNE